MSSMLCLANHSEAEDYWAGGDYTLNMSFGVLRDKQWQRLMHVLWNHASLRGPFAERYIPGQPVEERAIQVPAKTTAQSQYGQVLFDTLAVGCRVQATRSLFECVSVQVPLGMFQDIRAGQEKKVRTSLLRIEPMDRMFRDICLVVYDVVPFDLANTGYQCECRLVNELRADTSLRLELLAMGNFFGRDEVLRSISIVPENYPAVRPGLRWIPS